MPGGTLTAHWEAMQRRDIEPGFEVNPIYKTGKVKAPDEIWTNDRYQCIVHYNEAKESDVVMKHLSIHSFDRGPMRNWRHLQQIKNEVCGEESTGIEFFPPESQLTDTANEYHLWVFPPSFDMGFGLGHEALVTDDEMAEDFTEDPRHKGRQEPWEPGLTTGRSEASKPSRERLRELREKGEV